MMPQPQRHRVAFGWADLGALAAILVAVAAAFLLDRASLSDGGRLTVGHLLVLVPPLAWLVLFYRRDRAEPEPRQYVVGVAALAGLIAAGVGESMIDALEAGAAFGSSLPARLLAAIVVVGLVREAAAYAAIRFSVFGSEEFDDVMDGLIYGTAAGLGYATAVNFMFVIDASGFDLGPAMVRIAVFSLAYASLGGLVGVALAQYRHAGRPPWWPAAGVGAAAILGGIFFVLRNQVSSGVGGGGAGRWWSLAGALFLAVALTAALLAAVGGSLRQRESA